MLRRRWPIGVGAFLALASFSFLLRGEVPAARDLYGQFFPETWILAERWRALEVPLWLPQERLGQPFLALLYTQALYPPRVVTALLFGHVVGPAVMHVFHTLWAMAGAFFALRRAGRSQLASCLGGVAFAFSPFFVELSQNLAFASTAAWAGWTWWAAEGVVRRPSWRSAAWVAAVLGAAFHAGAPEMWLWQAGLVGLVTAARARRFGLLGVCWALGCGAVVGLPAVELLLEWTDPARPAGGLLAWSMSWQQLISIALPDVDFPRSEPFFGADQRFFFTLLLGPTVVALAHLGARRRSRPLVWLAVGCAVLALGAHFVPSTWILQLPPFRLFRFPVKYAVGLLFALSMLAAFGLDRLQAVARRGGELPRLFAAGFVGVAMGGFLASRLLPEVRGGFVAGAAWGLVSAAVVAGALQLRARRPLLLGWLVVELLVMPRREWAPVPVERLTRPSPIARTIRGEPHGRVSLRVDMADPGGPWCDAEDPEGEADRVVLDSRQRLSVLRFLEEGLWSTSGYGFREPMRLERAFEAGRPAFQLAGVTHAVRNRGVPLPFEARRQTRQGFPICGCGGCPAPFRGAGSCTRSGRCPTRRPGRCFARARTLRWAWRPFIAPSPWPGPGSAAGRGCERRATRAPRSSPRRSRRVPLAWWSSATRGFQAGRWTSMACAATRCGSGASCAASRWTGERIGWCGGTARSPGASAWG